MTKDEILAMAKEASETDCLSEGMTWEEKFAHLVAAKEREACARLCEGWAEGDDCAAAIRERK